jgi:DNA-binding response OmpR family regulator
MNGRQLAARLTAESPSLRVLYMSGYTDDEVLRRGVVNSEVDFLHKPFTPRELLVKVEDVLRRGAVDRRLH